MKGKGKRGRERTEALMMPGNAEGDGNELGKIFGKIKGRKGIKRRG